MPLHCFETEMTFSGKLKCKKKHISTKMTLLWPRGRSKKTQRKIVKIVYTSQKMRNSKFCLARAKASRALRGVHVHSNSVSLDNAPQYLLLLSLSLLSLSLLLSLLLLLLIRLIKAS